MLFVLLVFIYGTCIAGGGASPALLPPLGSFLPPAVGGWFGKRVMDMEGRVAVFCDRKTVRTFRRRSEHENLLKNLKISSHI